MSLAVAITAKDGVQHQFDARSIANIKELRLWIERQTGLAPGNQILLSGRATQLREATLSEETEVFIFDRKILEPNVKPPLVPIPPIVGHPQPPNESQIQKDITAWVNVFQKRLQWAELVLGKGRSLAASISNAEAQIKNIQRSVTVAFDNLETHVTQARNKLLEKQEAAGAALRRQEDVFTNWERSVQLAGQIPVHPGFANLATRQASNSRTQMLSDLLNFVELKQAAAAAELKAQDFVNDMERLRLRVGEVEQKTTHLRDQIQETSVGSSGNYQSDEPQNIVMEMEVVTRKMRGDYDRVQEAQSSVSAAKWAQAHIKEYIPGLIGLLTEMSRLHQQAVSQKNQVITSAHKNLIGVVSIQSILGMNQPLLERTILSESDSYLYLARAHQLPYVYGALLVECVRRKEWTDKLTEESKRLAEDLANLKSEEEKRRKRWQKQVGAMLPFSLGTESRLLDLDINLESGEDRWPQVTRQDVEYFLEHCKNIPGMSDTLKEVTQLYQDLDKPLRKQPRKVKGFKLGSVHEAAMGNSTYLNDNTRELQEKIAFYESQDANQKSRIRRLEDLLHRAFGRGAAGPTIPPSSPIPGQYPSQNILGSSPSMNGFNQGFSQGFGPASGPTSITSRRLSGNVEQSEKERNLAAKVLALEAELAQERDRIAQLSKNIEEREAQDKEKNLRISEADHTKNDLLANLEAQQQEFLLERKELHTQLEELRFKLDEAYEELDKVEEKKSQELERKSELERKLELAEDELVNAIDEREKWQRKYSEEVEKLRKERDDGTEHFKRDFEVERARNINLEALVKDLKEEISRQGSTISNLEGTLQDIQAKLDKAVQQYNTAIQNQGTSLIKLQQAHKTLAPQDIAPKDLRLLADTIEVLALKTVSQDKRKLDELQEKYDQAKAALNKMQSRFESRTDRTRELAQRLFTYNTRATQLLETLGFSVTYRDNTMQVMRLSRTNSESMTMSKSMIAASSANTVDAAIQNTTDKKPTSASYTPEDISLLYWMDASSSDSESEKYAQFMNSIGLLDLDTFSDSIVKRLKEAEHIARRWQKEAKAYREKSHRYHAEASEKIAFKSFKDGDLALFLPTRNQVTRPWAAFNVGAPHYFLKEHDSHKLRNRDWLLARIHKVEERVVDLSRSTNSLNANPSVASDGASMDDENPFELSDGLRWYLLEAYEEKPGAPTTPGLSSSTVFSSKVDAKGSLKSRKPMSGAKKTLTHLQEGEHRRRGSSSSIGRASIFGLVAGGGAVGAHGAGGASEGNVDSAVATAGGSRASTPALMSRPTTAVTEAVPSSSTAPPTTQTPVGSISKGKQVLSPSGTADEKLADLQSMLQSRML